jgi:hypothetical protein
MINVVQLSQQMYDTDYTVLDKSTNRCNYHPNKESSEGWGVYAFPHTVTPPSEQPVMNGAYYCPPPLHPIKKVCPPPPPSQKKGKEMDIISTYYKFYFACLFFWKLGKTLDTDHRGMYLEKEYGHPKKRKIFWQSFSPTSSLPSELKSLK